MGFDQDKDYLESQFLPEKGADEPPSSPPPPRQETHYEPYRRPKKRFSGWRVIWGILFGLSFLANIGLFLLLISLVFVVAGGQTGALNETLVRDGPRDTKIVLVNLQGMIHGEQANRIRRQLDAARGDRAVKALIVRVNSSGGTISGSDRIYHEILRYRRETGQPVVAFMQGVAASGGYYAAVACDTIVAEPTTITGSIGVIMSYFVFEELLENTLGIQPVFLTAGDKKDWPSSFRAPKQEELDYIQERLLTPAYERFIEIVQAGRSSVLSAERVRTLADGSIYGAPKAHEEKLIDQVGYLDDAIATAKSLANLQEAQVVEYRRMFSFMDFLNAKSEASFKFDRETLYEFSAPQVLYMWSGY